jgi:hypothetical protein
MTIPGVFSSIASAMRESPSCMAALIVAAMFSTYIYLFMSAERVEMHQRQVNLIDRCTVQMK